MAIRINGTRTTIFSVAYHRNGVSGKGFHVVLFRFGKQSMVATVFEGPGQVAVLDADLL